MVDGVPEAAMKRVTVFAGLLLALGGCAETHSPTRPTVDTRSPEVFILSGTVYEHTPAGQRPLANVPLDIGSSGIPFYRSDGDGRYRVELPGWMGRGYVARASLSGFHQPCRASIALQDTPNVLDIHLVAESTLRSSGVPSSLPVLNPQVSGQIVERTLQGDVPVSGALVSGEFGWELNDEPSVRITTVSDGTGRYLMCGADGATGVSVTAAGYLPARAAVNLRTSSFYDFTLVRR
jgi:hypothetical protein